MKKRLLFNITLACGYLPMGVGTLIFMIWWGAREFYALDLYKLERMGYGWALIALGILFTGLMLLLVFLVKNRDLIRAVIIIVLLAMNYPVSRILISKQAELERYAYVRVENHTEQYAIAANIHPYFSGSDAVQLKRGKGNVFRYIPEYTVAGDRMHTVNPATLIVEAAGKEHRMALPAIERDDCGRFYVDKNFGLRAVKESTKKKKARGYFLNDIDFEDGDYVLILEIKDKGKFWIDDEPLLEANRKKLKIDISFINYLPGEGYRGYGAMLFKDRQVVKSKHGGVFNVFEYGSLLENAQPFDSVAVKEEYYDTHKNLEAMNLEALKSNPDIYGLQLPEFQDTAYSHMLTVQFPSVAVPAHYDKDDPYRRLIVSNDFDKYAFGQTIYRRVEDDLRQLPLSGYSLFDKINKNAWQQSHQGMYVVYKNTDWEPVDNRDNHTIVIDDFILENYEIEILCDEQSLEVLKNHDWGKYVPEKIKNHRALQRSFEKALENSSHTPDNVTIDGFRKHLTVRGSPYQRKYSLHYIRKKSDTSI